jgi:hypothetical protein
MPIPNTFGAASARGFGLFSANLGSGSYIQIITNGGNSNNTSLALDPSRNVYINGGNDLGGTGGFGWMIKTLSNGSISFQNKLSNVSGQSISNTDICLDSSQNFYQVGYSSSASQDNNVLVNKYNSSGTIQWQRTLNANNLADVGYGIAVDASLNVYVTGYYNYADPTTGAVFFTAKYNSSGTLQWQKGLDTAAQYDYGSDIVVDSTPYIYVAGSETGNDGYLAKYDSSGVLQWQRKLVPSSGYDAYQSLGIDSSSNLYPCGQTSALANTCISLAKYNSSGTIQWQRSYGSTLAMQGPTSYTDSSGNSWVAATEVGNPARCFFAKFDTSGALVLQRQITVNQGALGLICVPYKLYADNTFIYITGVFQGASYNDAFIMKFPVAGTKTGTYSVGGYTIIYAAATLTATTTTFTASTGTASDITATMTSSTSTFTTGTPSFTSSVLTV